MSIKEYPGIKKTIHIRTIFYHYYVQNMECCGFIFINAKVKSDVMGVLIY